MIEVEIVRIVELMIIWTIDCVFTILFFNIMIIVYKSHVTFPFELCNVLTESASIIGRGIQYKVYITVDEPDKNVGHPTEQYYKVVFKFRTCMLNVC